MLSALMSQAEEAFRAAQWEQASQGLVAVLRQEPENILACQRLAQVRAVRGNLKLVVQTYLQLMQLLEAQENLPAALQVADWIRAIQPDSVEVRERAMELYLRMGDEVSAFKEARALVRHYVDLGVGEQALALLSRMQQLQPDNLELGLELAETLVVQGHLREGATRYRQMGEILRQLGQLEKATEAYRRLKLLVPEDCACRLELGQLYVRLEQFSEAEQEFRAVLRQNLNHYDALMSLGEVCLQRGRWRDAQLAFQRIFSLDPDSLVVRQRLGDVYRFQGQLEEAVAHYLEAARICLGSQQKEEAVRLYRMVLSLQPDHPLAVEALAGLDASLEPLDPPTTQVVTPVQELPEPLQGAGSPSGRLSRAGLQPRRVGKPKFGESRSQPKVEPMILRNSEKPWLSARSRVCAAQELDGIAPVVEAQAASWFDLEIQPEEEASSLPDWLQEVYVDWLVVAREQLEMGHKEAAESAYLRALKGDAKMEARWELAHLYLMHFRDLEQALREYAVLHQEWPANVELTSEYAATLLDLGRVEESISVLRVTPEGSWTAWRVLAEFEALVAELPEASSHRTVLEHFRRALGAWEAEEVDLAVPVSESWLTEELGDWPGCEAAGISL